MQINLEFMSVLAECQQNFHLPERMKEGYHMYTYFSYPVTSCFFIPQMANNPIWYAAIMTLWNVALPGFVIISNVCGIVNVMWQQLFVYLFWVFLGTIILAQFAQWCLDYKMWNHSISMYTGRCWQQSFWNYGLFLPTAEVSGFLEYQIHVEGIVLCFLSSIRCIKIWIAIC